MGIESSSTEGAPNTISRRRVVAGAAWTVPAVMVASAAPAVAASQGPLDFTGKACKLPGEATDIFKGYVFELTAYNAPGPNPTTGVTVITDVTIGGQPVTGYQVYVASGPTCSCNGCTPTGSTDCNTFCTPDGATQRILVYTNTQTNSKNTEMTLKYQRYECDGCTAIDAAPVLLSSGTLSTDPATKGGGSCDIVGAVSNEANLSPNCA